MGDLQGDPFVGSAFSEADFLRIRELVLGLRGFDLRMYKDRCIKRRIARRVRALGLQDADAYIARLRDNEQEAEALLAALAVHVSQFFRNPQIFALLEKEVLPTLLARALASPSRRLRVWSVGCAGGEEPYSVALLCEHQALLGVEISILGTDLSDAILERARAGLFDPLRVAEVPPAVLKTCFDQEAQGYRLRERIRRRVEFRRHDILSASDFPPADLILCRNVLIYFSRPDQDRILRHFAEILSPGGYLVLGNAENIFGPLRDRFRLEFPAERIYSCF